MARPLLLLALALLVVPRPAHADQDDPTLQGRPLSEWVEMLRGDRSADRRRAALLAVERIGPAKSPRVVPAVIAALRDDADERLREAAAAALGRLGERLAARTTAEPVPFTAGRDALVAALRTDKSARARAAAATALGKLNPTDAAAAVPELAAAVGSTDTPPAVRAAAADTLSRLGKRAADAVPALRQALEDRSADAVTRARAALALGNVGEESAADALPTLQNVLGDAQAPVGVRKAVAETLGRIGPDAAASSARLGELLAAKGADVELRRASAAALDQFGAAARPALPALRQALQDDDRFVRGLALHAIGQQGAALGSEAHPTVTAVLACLGDRVVEVRVAAAEAVAGLGAEGLGADLPVARERLREATRDGQKAVREAAEEAIKKLPPPP
jgi:HEAT repeat protein